MQTHIKLQNANICTSKIYLYTICYIIFLIFGMKCIRFVCKWYLYVNSFILILVLCPKYPLVLLFQIWLCPYPCHARSGSGASLIVLPRIGLHLSGSGLSVAPPHRYCRLSPAILRIKYSIYLKPKRPPFREAVFTSNKYIYYLLPHHLHHSIPLLCFKAQEIYTGRQVLCIRNNSIRFRLCNLMHYATIQI
jgi:hypothetical protein